MAIPLKFNTASQEFSFGQALDNTDGDTEESGLTIANTDIKLHKAGTTTLVNKNSGGATYISNGVWYGTFDATDTNTYGPMTMYIHVAGALAMKVEFEVMNATAYDALYGAGNFDVNITQLGGSTQSATDLKDFADAGYDPSTNKIQGVVLVDSVTGGATSTAQTTAQDDLNKITGSDGATLATAQANYAPAKAGDNMGTVSSVTGNVGGSVASVAAINTTAGAIDTVITTTNNTDMRGTDGANTTVPDNTSITAILTDTDTTIPDLIAALNNLNATQINAEIVDALNVDTYAEPGQGAPAATTSLVAKINYLYKAWRNKTEQTATTLSIYNDAGTVVDQKATVSDDLTTATNGEIVSGP